MSIFCILVLMGGNFGDNIGSEELEFCRNKGYVINPYLFSPDIIEFNNSYYVECCQADKFAKKDYNETSDCNIYEWVFKK